MNHPAGRRSFHSQPIFRLSALLGCLTIWLLAEVPVRATGGSEKALLADVPWPRLLFMPYVLNGLILIGSTLLAAGVILVTNWLALIPWRRSKGEHWSEQARLLYPAMFAARSNLLIIPGIITLSMRLLWPQASPLWVLTGIASLLGAYAGTLAMYREVFPRILLRDCLRQVATRILMQLPILLVFIGAAALMPSEFTGLAFAIAGTVIVSWVLWVRGGCVWVGRKLGLFVPAPARLQNIAEKASARMNVPFCRVLLMRSSFAQAFALPASRQLLFTERLLELLPDAEIAAICSHELAHLTESQAVRYSRSIVILTYAPWMFFSPLVHAFGFVAFIGLLFITLSVPRIYGRISRKLESRADEMAKANEGDAGTYARALMRIYADSLSPAVTGKVRAMHPHLYDRLLAAGVTPDFPRPAAPGATAWHARMFAALAVLLFAAFALQQMNLFSRAG